MEAKEPLILIPAFTLCEGIQKKKEKKKEIFTVCRLLQPTVCIVCARLRELV